MPAEVSTQPRPTLRTSGRPLVVGILGLCAAGLLAAGCAHYHPRPISAASTLDSLESRRLDASDLERYMRDRGGLERAPGEPWDLPSLTFVAFYYSPELDVARARWGVARAGRITAGERPNPMLSVSQGYNSSTPAGTTPWIPEVVLDIPIETAGKRGIRISEARDLSEAARLDVLSVAWQVRSGVRRAFVDLFVARETGSLLTEQKELQAENVRILELQMAAGEVSANEVTQARIALDQSRLAALEAAQQGEQARVHLAQTVGLPVQALDGVAFSFDGLRHVEGELPANEIRRRALMSRTDILGALSEYEASQEALQLEIAKQYPDLDIGAGYQLDQTDSKWKLGLNLTLPVLNRNRGPIAEAEARRTEAAARFQALQSRVIAEIDGAVVSLGAAAERTTAADALLANLEAREASAESAYRLGQIARLELVASRMEMASGKLARLDALARTQQAKGELEDAMQAPLDVQGWVLETPKRSVGREEPHHE